MATGFPKPQFRKFTSNKDQTARTAERDRVIWEARIRGVTPTQIARDMGLTVHDVYASITRAAQNIRLENAPDMIKAEVERLDTLLQNAIDVLETTHYATSHGKVLMDPTTLNDPSKEPKPLIDTQPVLKAIDTIIRLMERRAKLLGLDAPSRTEAAISLTQTTTEDLELIDMINQVKAQMALGLDNIDQTKNGR